ncbi:hypothetical protein EPUL_002770 [Erysiphe pulchra]|uniref:Uncharacterized protein n=1 Tax=Erysiphe pulchra TaxID=225359 RepID=A0A2S4PSJ7_9PEZI|nr:hypothetical protein EPUL_002770 [Erysiphe pulchra]
MASAKEESQNARNKMHKNIATFSSPPIKHEGQVYEGPVDKALVLTKVLLQRRTIDDAFSVGNIPMEHQVRIQVQDNIGELEVKHCFLHVTSSAPGDDRISVPKIHLKYNDPRHTQTLTAALDRGAAVREAARISRDKTVLLVVKAHDNNLPDIKKNCSESAELFEKVLLTADEDLAAARPQNISHLTSNL